MDEFSIKFDLDFSGIHQFMKTLSFLEKDIEPPNEVWRSLFNTPGYKTLIENEFSEEFFKDNFKLAFMPHREKLLKEKLTKKDLVSQFLEHNLRVKILKMTSLK